MDTEEREQKVILPKLQAQLEYAYENSPFYRKKWNSAGVKPEDIRSLADFEQMKEEKVLSYSVRAAITVLTIGPIVLLYPFVQKHFIKGVFMGSLKG